MKKDSKACFLAALLLLSALHLSADVPAEQVSKSGLQSLYAVLDSLILHQQEIIDDKNQRIRTIHEATAALTLTPEQQYDLNNRLYDEYLAFRFDSALFYIQKNVDMLPLADNDHQAAASRIRMAHILAVSGLFERADRLLAQIDVSRLSSQMRTQYYNQKGELALYHSEMAQFTPYFTDYIDSAQYYRQLILQIAPKESFDYVFNLATYTSENGNTLKAIQLLEDLLSRQSQGERQYSIVTSTLAYFYGRQQNQPMQERYLLLSAISDLRGAILENNSLRELAALLMQRGEYKKAYAYLTQASNDANLYGSRLRSVQVARLAPLITHAYDAERTANQQRIYLLLAAISVIALMLVISMAYTLVLLRKRRASTRKIESMNSLLSAQKAQVELSNQQMKEANRIKEEYIGRFLELCSALIHRGEERNKQLRRLARDKKSAELYAELKSTEAITDGIRLFHQNFDTAFLNIYPDFISKVNLLMTPENQFQTETETSRLTTELRILALIRLGIVDNQTIADILRSSKTTIYTYRSRLKARAKQKESFEENIRSIATY